MKLANIVNGLAVLAFTMILLIATGLQFEIHELPCPLCLLQRVGLFAICFGLLLNLRYGNKSMHYALSLLAALYTAAVSMRQILLHIIPGSQAYGSQILGFSLYTWTFIIAVATIIWITFMLFIPNNSSQTSKKVSLLGKVSFTFFLLVLGTNAASSFFECGFKQCPDNPVHYII